MGFSDELLDYRIRSGLLPDDAADLTGMHVQTYLDIEEGRYTVPQTQQIGIFVCLGMQVREAKKIAFRVQAHSMLELLDDPKIRGAKAKDVIDPFVFRRDGCLRLSRRDGFFYDIENERVDTAEKALRWIPHLAGKSWMTRKHFRALGLQFLMDLGIPPSPMP